VGQGALFEGVSRRLDFSDKRRYLFSTFEPEVSVMTDGVIIDI
jgi:hypothetical protein